MFERFLSFAEDGPWGVRRVFALALFGLANLLATALCIAAVCGAVYGLVKLGELSPAEGRDDCDPAMHYYRGGC